MDEATNSKIHELEWSREERSQESRNKSGAGRGQADIEANDCETENHLGFVAMDVSYN